ncbi:MAG: hypothetical protein ACJ8NR_12580 [Sulfurifustis sp.]
MKNIYRGIAVALMGWSVCFTTPGANADTPRGVAVTPRNFPNHTGVDVDQAFSYAHDLGRHAVFIYQWSEIDPTVVRALFEKAKNAKLIPILGLSPTTLDQGRKELDLPATVRRQAGSNVSFSNPIIRAAYIKAATDLARLRPAYLCLATEINFLALQRLPEYLHFVTLYKEAYAAVKKISPATKVFVTFQWEWVRILDAREPNRISEHSNVINVFRPELDLVGFTTYPAAFHDAPAQLPSDYYAWMFHHIPPNEPVLFMEVGWPTSGSGNEAEQLAFLRRLPALMKGIHLAGLEWALLHDVQLGAFDANLNTVGLRYRDGRPKPGYDAFRTLTLP